MKIFKLFRITAIALVLLSASFLMGQKSMMNENTKMVGRAAMYPSKDIISNAVNSADHITLVAAVKAAGLVETLQGEGPFKVFAPTNTAFEKLPEGTVASLLEPGNKSTLQAVLTYHVLAGKYNAADIVEAIRKGNGKATFTTVDGTELTAMLKGKKEQLKDVAGNISTVSISDVNQSNGVIHVIDTVELPVM
ncbi:Uncaracterized surface protein containing fasciclin (FAS1) repeats [Muriicola jejuensis]|uniref:Fasciclin domain-containing protein n=1 Tax=Muriicola jejuensis TaxID=504488 RepID=A0A6P0U904_9FLAO|nr:fasciclin domain-containing protein [Muriicola jejuensis]NER09022.1 fasciclin domain-containing protein [Muriicola jejuensis]SMP12060.1 Uncaracterized surface protein containing fasciclin (FAS1) repeats [Muriicola jejuensis]